MLLSKWGLSQQSEEQVPLVTKTIALTNVNIITKPGTQIEKGNLVIQNGIIQNVGAKITIPADAKVLEGDSLYVYPGFIDGFSHTGIPAPKTENRNNSFSRGSRTGPSVKNPGNPPNDKAGILPEILARDLINTEDKSIQQMRSIGITTAHVVPRKGMLAGKGVIVNLNGKSINEMIINDQTSLAASFSTARRMFPATIIGVMSKFRDLYKQTEQLMDHMKKFEATPNGMPRPNMDKALEALIPAVSKEIPVFFSASDAKSIHRVFMMQQELGFKLALVNVKQGWHSLSQIKEQKVPVFLSLELPKEDQTKEMVKKEEKDSEMAAIEKRRAEVIKEYLSQAATFEKNDVPFGFSFASVKSTDVHKNIRSLIKNGLSEDKALEALTMAPAKLLDLEQVLGSIEKGKIGNVVVSKQPLFSEKSSIKYVIVEGQVFEYKLKKSNKKKGLKKGKPSDFNSF